MAKKKKSSKPEPEFDIKSRLGNIKVLLKSERPKEAIAYIYLIYNALMSHKYKKARLPHQTIREYAITSVNELNQKPETTYPFIKKIEDIIYGGVEPNEKEFEYTIQLFSNLYNQITGKSFSFSA